MSVAGAPIPSFLDCEGTADQGGGTKGRRKELVESLQKRGEVRYVI